MRDLFDKTTINGMTLQNRFVRSATWEGMCNPDGCPTGRLIKCYRDLARGGVGLIISGYTFVRPDGRQLPVGPTRLGGTIVRMPDDLHRKFVF